ncbi:hypothetical protein [Streptomyces liangshanensis]|uniref:Uncharacterized protein n=1 Tax=Streptomyces liangshanensis TaxID=2717324 RepID=A0A6G9GTF6_9ACTN|nr:hypothetical protein [Streptomyces liangshanensis]QIQ01484.1 hypothetical protein HA039_03495 [Streptomyces liangshanensis]
MADTLDELVELQRAADKAQDRAGELRAAFGPPAVEPWTEGQRSTYETAWRAWRDLDRDIKDAITRYAKRETLDRATVERTVRARVEGRPDEASDDG